jgi:HD-like signal output (HDOD) protein
MLSRIARLFTRSTSTAARVSSPPGRAVRTSRPAAVASAAAAGGDTDRRRIEEAAHARLEGALHAEFYRRREELLKEAGAGSRHGDAAAFLTALGERFDVLIRQPPVAAQEALAIARDEAAGLAALVRLVGKDPALLQSLLASANSAWYQTGGAPCASARDGVQRLGSDGVEGILLASLAEGLLCRPGAAFAPLMNKVWSHMVRTAPIARQLASAFSVVPEQAFTLGLLHDVGKLVLFDRLAALRATLRRDVKLAPGVVHNILQRLHEPLGGVAAIQWGMGRVAACAIATHHRVPAPPEPTPLGEVLFVAERADLARVRGVEIDCDWLWSMSALTGEQARARTMLDHYFATGNG